MRRATIAATVGLLFLVGCNHLPWMRHPVENTGLHVDAPNPTAQDLVRVLNENSQRVQTLECRDVALDCRQGTESAGLQAILVCQPKERNFRMNGFALGNVEVDLGSNRQEFWFWIKRAPEPYLYHCSHQDFASGAAARLQFPFQPDWIIEALGVAQYDPSRNYELVPHPDRVTFDLVERTVSPQGQQVRKVTRFTRSQNQMQVTAHILEDANGKEICAAIVREVQPDRTSGAVLPRQVVLAWPAQQIQMKMTLDRIAVNGAIDQQRVAKLFTRPVLNGVQTYDLARGPDTPGSIRPAGGAYR